MSDFKEPTPKDNEPVIPTLPVNSCLSFCASPNLLLPLA